MKVEEAKVERYLHEATHPSDMAWLDPISKWVSADTQLESTHVHRLQVRHPLLQGQLQEGDPGQHQHGLDHRQVQERGGEVWHDQTVRKIKNHTNV